MVDLIFSVYIQPNHAAVFGVPFHLLPLTVVSLRSSYQDTVQQQEKKG